MPSARHCACSAGSAVLGLYRLGKDMVKNLRFLRLETSLTDKSHNSPQRARRTQSFSLYFSLRLEKFCQSIRIGEWKLEIIQSPISTLYFPISQIKKPKSSVEDEMGLIPRYHLSSQHNKCRALYPDQHQGIAVTGAPVPVYFFR